MDHEVRLGACRRDKLKPVQPHEKWLNCELLYHISDDRSYIEVEGLTHPLYVRTEYLREKDR